MNQNNMINQKKKTDTQNHDTFVTPPIDDEGWHINGQIDELQSWLSIGIYLST